VATAQVIDVIFRGRNDADAAIRQVEQGLSAVDKAGEGLSKSDQALQTMATTLSRIGPLLLAAFGVTAVSDLAAKFVAANVEVEKFTRAVTQISGSSIAAGQELDYLRSVSDRLGLSTRGTADAYVGLLAATRNTSLEGAQTRSIFESIATAMSLLGRSSADTEGALLAIQQIISKGTVSSEELRGQLGERLPGAFGIAARAVGVTTEQLGKMLEQGQVIAADFLPKFAAELDNTFGRPENVDTYVAAVNRLGNAFDEALQAIGQTGAFDLLTQFLKGAGSEIKEFGVVTEDLVTKFGAFRNLLRGGSWEVFIAEVDIANNKLQAFNATNSGSNQTLAETARLNRQAADAYAESGDAIDKSNVTILAKSQAEALKEVGEAFKTLGVNPTKINNDVTAIIDAFKRISDDPSITGETLVAGLDGAIKKVRDSGSLQSLRIEFAEAFGAGRISVEQLYQGLGELDKAQEKLDKSAGKNVDSASDRAEALKKEAKAAEDAQRAAQQYALELEKLASNERIKLIEARVTLNVTEVQEQTKRIQAAFESLDNTVNSTANVINESFGLFAKLGQDSADSAVRDRLFDQIDIENRNRERALKQQEKLNEAQIKVMEAQARNLENGEALIKVDGTGLAPHLEAIMWEIMKLVQVRTNRDGLKLLLGV
jgi:tape measure domain-containing protein